MNTLREVQEAFALALSANQTPGLVKMVHGGRFAPQELIRVYQNNFELGFSDALAAIYLSLNKIVGDAFFTQLVRQYLRQYPSCSGDLHQFGSEMASFLETNTSLKGLPYVSDIAAIDWAWHQVFHAESPSSFDPGTLQQQSQGPQDDISFVFNSSFRLLGNQRSVFRLWCHCRDIPGFEAESNLTFDPEPEYVLLYRQGLDVVVERLSTSQGQLLHRLCDGESLQQACAGLCLEEEFQLLEFLRFILSSGMVRAIGQSAVPE